MAIGIDVLVARVKDAMANQCADLGTAHAERLELLAREHAPLPTSEVLWV